MPAPAPFGVAVSLNIGNFSAAGNQLWPRVEALATGRILAAWNTANAHQLGYFASDGATGTALRTFSVATGTLGPDGAAQIDLTTLADGRQVAAWRTNDVDAAGDLAFQFFDLTGGASGFTAIANAGADAAPVVNSTAISDFTILYQGAGTGSDVFRRSYMSTGAVDLGPGELSSGAFVAGDQEQPAIAGLAGGANQIAVWTDRSDNSIKGRFLLFEGSRLGSTLTLTAAGQAPAVSGDQSDLVGVSGLPNGGFVVAWGHPSGGADAFFRVFDQNGAPTTAVLTAAGMGSGAAKVLGLQDGRFVVVGHAPGGGDIVGQVYKGDGTADGAQFAVANTAAAEGMPDLTLLPDGRFAVAYAAEGVAGGADRDIVMKIFDPRIAGVLVVGTAQADEYHGSAFNDLLYGDGGADALYGGAGNDNLDGGAGADLLVGGAGDDFYGVDNPGDVVVEAPGEGTDIVSTSLATFILPANVENMSCPTGVSQTIVGNASRNNIHGGGPSALYGLGGDDLLIGGGASTLDGGDGDDSIYGGAGNDYCIGGGGADVIVGLGGADSLYGGEGNDYIVAGDGPGSVVDGGAGSNTLWGASGNDYMVGGEGADLMVGAAGADYLFGNAGNDTLYGGQGGDFIYTNAGDDFIWTDDVGAPQSTDYIYVGGGTGVDTVADFTAGDGANHDVLVISPASGIGSFAQAQAAMAQVGVYTVLTMAGGDQIYLYNVQPFELTAADFLFF